jgi:Xaa-Pro aminopeptidase
MSDDNAVYAARMQRAREVMDSQGIDHLFITPSSDLTYMLGYPAHSSERLPLLCVPREGEPFAVAPSLEAMRLKSRGDLLDVHAWGETESPTELTARLLEGGKGARIAIADQTWAIFLLRLQAALPDASFVPGNDVLRDLRMIKDEHELEIMRVASARTDAAWAEFVATGHMGGRTEQEVAADINRLLIEHGMDAEGFCIVGSGPASASPHHMTSERVIRTGDSVVCDFGGVLQHYYSDITRTVNVGEPGDEYRRAYEVVLQANRAALAAAGPGVACQEIDRAARSVITAAGYGEYFIHRVGHGLGLDVHEDPYMVEGNALPLQPGMVFSDEPGVYIPGRFGVRIEDILVCTADGADSLNHVARDLVVMN